MSTANDDWDIQEAYEEDPKKAIFFLSSLILQPEKLATRMVKSINTQTELQDALKNLHLKHLEKDTDINKALFAIIAKERWQFWTNLIMSKKGAVVFVVLIMLGLGYKLNPGLFRSIGQFLA